MATHQFYVGNPSILIKLIPVLNHIWDILFCVLKWNKVDNFLFKYSRIFVQQYTQSQKKRTMNSLASHATQGQGQVTPAGLYLIMLCFGICKTATIPLQSRQIRYFSQMIHFIWPTVYGIESWDLF